MLKERLYSKEKEIEQLQAELASALRNHDVLQSKIQDAFDTISCMNHKMKNLELQVGSKAKHYIIFLCFSFFICAFSFSTLGREGGGPL